ncbi:Microcystin-dependent protein [Clostridium acidisoli DSM 12555]|uniref:Microcystin-dependent protein n=1 Tax=Clostridium acidisoli DSM 12555 TaxID=1121291 RepID=A0A1W1X172_9CLOT|nr:hypothetical protein [Clostridium acidisoli]SMC17141.1 Microcystin-dependent protein [Clostridium acidisoli DSM 12555]
MFDGFYPLNLEVNKALVDLPDAKTSDHKSRGLDITRTLNGVVQNTAGQVIMLNAKTPDGRSVCALADVQDTNVGHYLLTYPTAMMTVAGEVQVELTIVDTTGTISTNTGTVNIVQAVANYGDVEDDSNFPALLQAMQQLQTMQAQITTMQASISALEHFETGAIIMSATPLNSTYWLPLDGRATTGYSGLAAIYGANLPNASGRFPVQIDTTQTEFNTLGKTGGEKTHVLSTAEMPSHNHPNRFYRSCDENNGHYSAYPQGWPGYGGFADRVMVWINQGETGNQNFIDNAGGGQAHNTLPPYIVLGKWYVHI